MTGFSIPKVRCEAPQCEEEGTDSIIFKARPITSFQGRSVANEPITVCAKHKRSFESGKMFPAFNRLKNADPQDPSKIFVRKQIKDFKRDSIHF